MTLTDDILWEVVRAVLVASWGLALWEAKRFLVRFKLLEDKVRELQDWRVAQTTRRHTWAEMGRPERRTKT